MPTYSYQCKNCDHRFKKFQSMTARVLRKCPECGETALERLIGTGAAILFKGEGFYATDYRSSSYKEAEKAEKDAGSGTSSGGSDKSGSDRVGGGSKEEN